MYRRHIKAFWIICFILLSIVSIGIAGKRFSPFTEYFPNGRIDWDEGVIWGVGRGYLDKNQGSKIYAMRAARTLALQSIVKIAAGINLDDKNVLKDLGRGRVLISIKALVYPEDHKSEFVENIARPYYEVTLKTPLSGVKGLTSNLIKAFKTTPGIWRGMPKPAGYSELFDQDEPWLVLDARNLRQENGVEPALFPKITTDQGETIYELDSVDENAVIQRGMARYVVSSESLENLRSEKESLQHILAEIREMLSVDSAFAGEGPKRKKRRRLIVKEVTQASGLTKTNLVISRNAAQELRAEDASSKILKQCRVIVIVNSPIGGIEGMFRDFIRISPLARLTR
ncbi:MAG: hypothetical protein KAI90_00430 [Desulfobulbaceae bacterium]|nr:hypothetical protein [Desulfobulbaceae bacterium]